MWYSYISIDIDRYFTKYLDIDRYQYTRHCSQTEWCKDPVQHLPIPLPAINRLQKVFTFVLNVVFSLTVNTNLPYGKQQKTLISKLSLTYKQFSRHYRWRCLEYLTPTLFFSASNELIGPNSMGTGYDYSYLRQAD